MTPLRTLASRPRQPTFIGTGSDQRAVGRYICGTGLQPVSSAGAGPNAVRDPGRMALAEGVGRRCVEDGGGGVGNVAAESREEGAHLRPRGPRRSAANETTRDFFDEPGIPSATWRPGHVPLGERP